MKALILAVLCSFPAMATEHLLQFTAPRGAATYGYTVVGTVINTESDVPASISGVCDYVVAISGGRGSGNSYLLVQGSCTWDLAGNLISHVLVGYEWCGRSPSLCVVHLPTPYFTSDSRTIYASTGGVTTGYDSALKGLNLTPGWGFVDSP